MSEQEAFIRILLAVSIMQGIGVYGVLRLVDLTAE